MRRKSAPVEDNYLHDHLGRELVVYNEYGHLKMLNIHGNGIIGRVEPYETGYELYYYVKDHLGSIRQTVNETGEIIAAQDYYPYGAFMRSYNLASETDKYKFTGKERDSETNYDYFGARYYNSAVGRWLQVDPLADKYPGWSPYNYVMNNPLVIVDPDGRKIVHHADNSNHFRSDFAVAIRYLNKHYAGGVIKALQDRNETIVLKEGKWKYDTYYDHSTKTLYWNPNYAYKTTNNGKQTPALGLVHESGHALGHLENEKEYLDRLIEEDNQYANKEKKRVIEDIENPAAKKLGEATSPDHRSTPYRTDGPTSTKKVKDPIYEEDN